MDLTVRVAGNAESLVPAVRRELRALDPSLPAPAVITARQRLGQQLGARRFQTQALVVFGGLALAFAAAGLYAALTSQVTLRRREIGIRTALGAGRRDIVGLFLRDGAALTLAGTAIGIAGAMLTSQVVQSLLYETAPLDLGSYLGAVAAVTIASTLAAALPARQASHVNPIIILKDG